MAYTPMIEQYLSIKKQYEDVFLFFRLGDFYEMFFEDAKRAAKTLEITLTAKNGGDGQKIPMCGVPYHSAEQYIKRLVTEGYKIAICEQVEDPKTAKGVVKREVVKLITPGTIMDGGTLSPNENNYLVSLASAEGRFALSAADLSTGEIQAAVTASTETLLHEISHYRCKELVVSKSFNTEILDSLIPAPAISFEETERCPDNCCTLLDETADLLIIRSSARLFNYLHQTQKRSLDHLKPVEVYELSEYMALNLQSKRNLELTETIREKKKYGSLLWLLDETKTAMGARKLKNWIEKPLISQKAIEERQAQVAALIEAFFERETLRESLDLVYDLERLVGRISYGNVNGRDLIQLKRSLEAVPSILDTLKDLGEARLKGAANRIDACGDVCELIEKSIMPEPPVSVTEGNLIRDGYHEQLDQYREAGRNGKEWLAALEQKEREETGIKSLKIRFNKVFGYYIEVTRSNLKYLPEGRYERKQTLANAERFVTPELKEKEKLILDAEEKSVDLEYELFQNVREKIKVESIRLQSLAAFLSEIDVLQSFAFVSDKYQYVQPVFNEDTLHLEDSRHPVVERVMRDPFVANDIHMDKSAEVLLITGPNMGGKSTYMRQTALTAIMAQIGCFVPAKSAVLPVFDQIFTRIGAADDLVAGQSTFMVEMLEARSALEKATSRSLILLDEIGRGTSTYDGIAIAQAIVTYIHDEIGAKTLFSTHYHELTGLGGSLSRLKNIHVGAKEEDGRVVFLHKVKDGAADESYGLHVAELAGLPESLIKEAGRILKTLENQSVGQTAENGYGSAEKEKQAAEQLSIFGEVAGRGQTLVQPGKNETAELITKELKKLDLMTMTPMEAFNTLYQLQEKVKKRP